MLKDLDHETVASHLVTAVLEHVGRLAFKLGETHDIGIKHLGWTDDAGAIHHNPASSSTLGGTMAMLCSWAKDGTGTDWGGEGESGCALDACQSIVEAYYGCASRAETPLDDLDSETQEDPVAIVLMAALARVGIMRGEGISPSRLAALASVGTSFLRQNYAPAGVLVKVGRGAISGESARTWLSGRGMVIAKVLQ